MVELPRPPVCRIVAGVTLITECTGMRIVIAVTLDAVGLGIVERGGCVTTVARNVRMCAEKWKSREVMIEPQARGPVGRDMATLALPTKLPLVHVVVDMTGTTFARQLVFQAADVTCGARKFVMPRRKREIGPGCMVKCHSAPVRYDVAATAVAPVLAIVYIVSAMTAITVAATEIKKVLGTMTVLAAKATMPAVQGKTGDRQMIEREVRPVRGAVAFCTLGAVASSMNVVAFVTCIACLPNVGENFTAMAGRTCCENMSTGQREAGDAVVE